MLIISTPMEVKIEGGFCHRVLCTEANVQCKIYGGFSSAKFNFHWLIRPLAGLSLGVGTVRPHEIAVARGWALLRPKNHESLSGCNWLIMSHR